MHVTAKLTNFPGFSVQREHFIVSNFSCSLMFGRNRMGQMDRHAFGYCVYRQSE
jgi:hypothetical protein